MVLFVCILKETDQKFHHLHVSASPRLSFTYLHIRMLRNPMSYGVSYDELRMDNTLLEKRRSLILEAVQKLMRCKMVRFDQRSGNFFPTDVGMFALRSVVEMYCG